VTRDPNRSLINAAKRGNADAQYQLAAMLATGDGMERDLTAAAQPGALFAWMGADGKYVVNLMTQAAAYGHGEKPGQATTEAAGHALRELAKLEEGEAALDRAAAPRDGRRRPRLKAGESADRARSQRVRRARLSLYHLS
jgi:TPR repeat protein